MVSGCKARGQAYNIAEVLLQHLRDSPLQQHLRDSPAHVVTFDCNEFDRLLDTNGALQQHLRDSPVHTKPGTRSDIYKIRGGQPNLMNSHGLKRKYIQIVIWL